MYDFKKLCLVLANTKEPHYNPEDFKHLSAASHLCLADNVKEAEKYGLNSVSLSDIDYLIESTWSLITMEEDDSELDNNLYSPLGEYEGTMETIDLLCSARSNFAKEKIF